MFMFLKNKKYLCILILIIITLCLIIPQSFAHDNSTSNDLGTHSENEDVLTSNNNVEISSTNNHLQSDNSAKSNNITLFIVSDSPGTNILDAAGNELFSSENMSNVNLVIRNGEQIKNMDEVELIYLLSSCDGFIGEWISTDVDSVLTNILGKYPELSNKQLFLILEPPSGKMNSGSSSISLIRNNTINYNKIFSSFSDADLISYFSNTKRGIYYQTVYNYITRNATNFNPLFNQMVLYKNLNDKKNLKNQILYALNFLGADFDFEAPTFTGSQQYGIYRDRWYSLDEYEATFFNPANTRTIGILESTMYIESQQLHPCYTIIESLESKGYNVIPIFAAGGSAEQLIVMIESWTSAGTDYSGFLLNSSNYEIYVDGIVSMVAYGVGGQNFSNATKFFEEAGVPVFRAVHSDYVSNEMWELGSTGLTTERSDKWWHITIAETQGIIDATFVGGRSSYISNRTGAQIITYIPHYRNIDLLTDRIDAWADLKYTSNGDKLISIIYYNYPPGKQNIGSSYLDTITSIYNMLYALKDQGYDVGELPNNVSELEDLMIKCGINVATWAPGELEKLANQSGVVLLSVDEYTYGSIHWMKLSKFRFVKVQSHTLVS